MNPRELRIGNLVYKEWIENGEILHKTEHEIDGHDLECLDVNGCFYQEGEAIPIPLTEEWLKRLGFSEYNLGVYYDGLFTLQVIDNEPWWIINSHDEVDGKSWHLCDIECVHQLQNLYFALTGEELSLQK